jgi:hypothetical protein
MIENLGVAQAQRVCINGIWFDSKIEGRVYRILLEFFSEDAIEVHYHIPLYPATERFKAIGWNIDFYIPSINLYVEVKGSLKTFTNREFKIKMHILERVSPHIIGKLVVVSDSPAQTLWGNSVTIGPENFRRLLRDTLKAT